jgi:hypothetical protein
MTSTYHGIDFFESQLCERLMNHLLDHFNLLGPHRVKSTSTEVVLDNRKAPLDRVELRLVAYVKYSIGILSSQGLTHDVRSVE